MSYSPNGGVPGGAQPASCTAVGNGIVISDEANVAADAGPIDVNAAVGAYRNYGTDVSGVYIGGGASGLIHRGIDAGASINAQVTLYNPPPSGSCGCE